MLRSIPLVEVTTFMNVLSCWSKWHASSLSAHEEETRKQETAEKIIMPDLEGKIF